MHQLNVTTFISSSRECDKVSGRLEGLMLERGLDKMLEKLASFNRTIAEVITDASSTTKKILSNFIVKANSFSS